MPEPEILSRTLAGQPLSVPQARKALRGFLGASTRTDDAELIVSEFATNAVRHSASRNADGSYELRLEAKPGRLRIEVVDQGAPARPAPAGKADEAVGEVYHRESGRGLTIVEALADEWGQEGRAGLTVWWAELWTEENPDA